MCARAVLMYAFSLDGDHRAVLIELGWPAWAAHLAVCSTGGVTLMTDKIPNVRCVTVALSTRHTVEGGCRTRVVAGEACTCSESRLFVYLISYIDTTWYP